MTPSASNRTPSAIDALGEGISHMREKLFPINFFGWITLGFVSLLESCGAGGGTGGVENQIGRGAGGGMGDPTHAIERVFGWIAGHMVIVVAILMAVMVLSLVFMWLRSRSIFVYIDDVATGRFDLVRPWNQHGAQADSFFALSLVVQGAMFVLVVLILGLGGLFVIWARGNDWTAGAIALGVIPIAFIFVLSLITAVVLGMVLRDFVAPIQVARGIGAQQAGGVFLSIISARPGLFIGYALLKFVASIAVGIVMAVGSCLTCCIGALPLINQTLFQPIYFAERAWSLKLLAQLGEDVFTKLAPPTTPSRYEYQDDAATGPIDLSQFDFETPPQT